MIPPPEVRELGIKDYLNIAKKNVWLIAICVLIITTAVAYYDFSQPKIYQVGVTLLIRQEVPEITGKEEIIYKKGLYTKRDQLELLSSRRLAKRVAKQLNLGTDNKIISKLKSRLAHVRSPAKSDVVNLYFNGKNSLKLVEIANTWVQEFKKLDLEEKGEVLNKGIESLKEEYINVEEKIEETEKEVTSFVKRNQLGKVPDIIQEGETPLAALKQKKEEIQRAINSAAEIYGEKHPRMLALEEELAGIEELLEKKREELFKLQEKMSRYRKLKEQVQIYRNLYQDYASRIREFELSKSRITSNVKILNDAHPPNKPIKPKPVKDIILAFLVSLALGGGLAYFRESLDSTLHNPEEVELYTTLSFFGEIPWEKIEKKKSVLRVRGPEFMLSESFMKIKVALSFSFPEEKPLKVLGVSSSIPAEGKTFSAAHISSAFAQSGEKILIIDGDLRKGCLANILGKKPKRGLSNVLAGNSTLEEAIEGTKIPNLYLLARGPISPNPVELLHSKKLDQVIEFGKKNFQKVIIDMPPVLATADALILGSRCDTNLLVIEADKTNLSLIIEAVKNLEKKVKVLGALLNKTTKDHKTYYYYYGETK